MTKPRRLASKGAGRLTAPRPRAAPLDDAIVRELLSDLSIAAQQLRNGEPLPAYLLAALRKFGRDWSADMDRVLAYKYVREAHDAGAPLSSRAANSAFVVAAKRLGRSVAWVEDAYRNRYPRARKRPAAT